MGARHSDDRSPLRPEAHVHPESHRHGADESSPPSSRPSPQEGAARHDRAGAPKSDSKGETDALEEREAAREVGLDGEADELEEREPAGGATRRKARRPRSGEDPGAPAREQQRRDALHDRATAGSERRRPSRGVRVAITGLLVPVLLVVVAFGVDRLVHRGEILRGVVVSGVELGGLDRVSAARALRQLADRARDEPLVVRVATQPFEIVPQTIGYSMDVDQTLDRAFAAGRGGSALAQLGWWLGRWFGPRRIEPVAALDEARLADAVAQWEQKAIEDRPFEGTLQVAGMDIVPAYPRSGRGVVRDGLTARMLDAIALARGEPLELPLGELAPRRERAEVDRAAREAAELTRAPVVLTAMLPPTPEPSESTGKGSKPSRPGAGAKPGAASSEDHEGTEGVLEPFDLSLGRSDLLAALRARPSSTDPVTLELSFDAEAIDAMLSKVRDRIEQPPRDARFVVDKHDHVEIVPGASGMVLDSAKIAQAALAAARRADRRGELPIERGARPKLDTEQAKRLGITKLVGHFTTQHPCCQPRVENIHRIADIVDGTVLLPGDTLSLNTLVGPRTKAAGYVAAPAIEEGEMVDAYGGGVSQFATTLFNAVFRAGYDVVERAPHTYYFRRYPMGLDATLSFPKPDLVFRNDTDAGLLIKTLHTKTSITVKLYGDVGKRKVEWNKSAPFDLVKPPTKFLPSDKRKPDSEKVKYPGQVGWSVYVSRTVTPEQGEPRKDRRKVTYKPRAREVEVHPCRIPKGEDGYTGKPCPEPEEPEEPEEEDAGVIGPPAGDEDGESTGSAAELIPPSLIDEP